MSSNYQQVNMRLPADLVAALKLIAANGDAGLSEIIRAPLEEFVKQNDDFIQIKIRMPRSLHAEISETAKKNGRSRNAEIVQRLKSGEH